MMLNLISVDISFPIARQGRVIVERKRVTLTADVPALMRQYNLSEPMIYALAQSYGGYRIAENVSTYNALMKRGFYTLDQYGYGATDLYRSVCNRLFIVESLKAKQQ